MTNIESFRRWFRSLFLPSDRLFYLAAFRVIAGSIILCKIMYLWPSMKFMFGPGGLFEYPPPELTSLGFIPQWLIRDNLALFYTLYAAAAALMIFGIGRRLTVFAVLIGTYIHQGLNWLLLDGGDNLLQFSLLYLAFANSFTHLSLSKKGPPRQEYAISHFLTNLAVAAIVAHLCLVYLISGLSKAHAEVWYNGTAMYYILLGERFQGTAWNGIVANNPVFNVVVCYTTIIWESTFCFAVFVKRLRIPILLMGVAMHLSIYVLMMIQTFQFIYLCHYGFFFTDDEWGRFLADVRSRLTSRPAPAANVDNRVPAGSPTAVSTSGRGNHRADSEPGIVVHQSAS